MIRKNQKTLITFQKLIDICLMIISIIIAFKIRFHNYPGTYLELKFYIIGAIVISPIYLWICSSLNLYKPHRTSIWIDEFLRIVYSTLILTVITLTALYVLKIVHISRMVIALFVVINILMLSVYRFLLRKFLRKIRSKGYNIKYILLVGENEILKKLNSILSVKEEYGYKVTKYRGEIGSLSKYLENNLIDEIFVAVEDKEADIIKEVYCISEKYGIKLNIIPSYSKYLFSKIYVDEFVGIPLINIREIPLESIFNRFIKRFMDIVLSVLILVISSPISLITAIMIKLTSKGPIIYKQQRVGINRKVFCMYKFRSMTVDTTFEGNIKANEDERCTKFGKFIRKYKIDEIPQFVNVLKGEMSIVGPRPEISTLVRKYKDEIPQYMLKHQVKCGITGLAQVKGYNGDTDLTKRIELDNEYINNWTLGLDIKIMLLTIPYILKNRGGKRE